MKFQLSETASKPAAICWKKTLWRSLTDLASLIKHSQFFIGLDSVASHIAASVDKDSITLFGPSNPVNWKPWSKKARIIVKEDLSCIEIKDVKNLIEEIVIK